MKNIVKIKAMFFTIWMCISNKQAIGQVPLADIIATGSKKVIMAYDLKVQRMQNETIWMQNAQKQIENILSQTQLQEISDWIQKQKDLYEGYFNELWQIKDAIAFYHRIEDIISKQTKIVSGYETAYNLFKQDNHFSADEIKYMEKVYDGLIDASLKDLDQLFLVIKSLTTQMTDEKRIEIIDNAGKAMDEVYNDLKAFNNENMMLSLQRSKDINEVAVVKQLYGLQ
jgi:hypothetical protein